MTPAALERAGVQLFGRQWKSPLAAALRVKRHTVDNWHAGRSAIPGPAVAALELLQRLQARSPDRRNPAANCASRAGQVH